MKTNSKPDLEYAVVRSKRKTADIVVERDGDLIVRAPDWVDDKRIAELVKSKEYWIYKNLAQWRELNATSVLREFKNGESFLYLGRCYRLSLVEEQKEPLLLKNGRFLLRRELLQSGQPDEAKKAFMAFYTTRGIKKILPRVTYFMPKVGVKPRGCGVRDLGHRWASCSPLGELAFHWKCMMAPLTVIDYIVVHELCHFHQINHSEAFWNEVDKILPDYRERKEWLRRRGAALNL